MKKIALLILLIASPASAVTYLDITALPNLGTPAGSSDSLLTYDFSASVGNRHTELKFSGSAADLLSGTGTWLTLTSIKSSMSLNLVENTALSTWTGSTNITTVGNVAATSYETSVSPTELGYLDGVSSAIQTQLDAKQAADADLTTYAGITPSANVQSLLGAPTYADMRSQIDLEPGTDFYSIAAADAEFLTPAELTSTLGTGFDTEAELIALTPITQTASVDDAGTLTPTAAYKENDIALTCLTDPSAITLSETGAINNAIIRVTNVGANTCTFAYAASNFEHKGGTGESLLMETGDYFEAQFQTDRWRVLVNNTSTQYFASLQVPTKTLDPVVGDPDSTTFTTAGTNLYGQRFVATATGTYAHSGVVSAGENWAIESQTATAVAVTVHASDTYYLNGTSCTAGVGLTSDSSVDAFVACQYQAANTVTCRGTSFTCTP